MSQWNTKTECVNIVKKFADCTAYCKYKCNINWNPQSNSETQMKESLMTLQRMQGKFRPNPQEVLHQNQLLPGSGNCWQQRDDLPKPFTDSPNPCANDFPDDVGRKP